MKLTLPCIYVGSLQVVFSINDNNKNQLQRVVTFAVQNTQAEIAAKSIHIADLWILPIFVQTLGLSHALTSFMWLCGPIAGLVVSTILFFAQMLFFFLTAVIIHWSFFLLPFRFNRSSVCTVTGAPRDGGAGGHLFWLDVCSSVLP